MLLRQQYAVIVEQLPVRCRESHTHRVIVRYHFR